MVNWILAALSTFTVSFILTKMDMFDGLRTRLGCYDYGLEQYPNGDPKPETALGRWVSCPICMSVFPVAPVIALLSQCTIITGWLGIAGASILMFRWRNW